MAEELLGRKGAADAPGELVRLDPRGGRGFLATAAAPGSRQWLCRVLLDAGVSLPRFALEVLLTPLAHRQPEASLEDDLKMRNVGKSAGVGDLRHGHACARQPLPDFLKAHSEDGFADRLALIFPETEIDKTARDAEVGYDIVHGDVLRRILADEAQGGRDEVRGRCDWRG